MLIIQWLGRRENRAGLLPRRGRREREREEERFKSAMRGKEERVLESSAETWKA